MLRMVANPTEKTTNSIACANQNTYGTVEADIAQQNCKNKLCATPDLCSHGYGVFVCSELVTFRLWRLDA